MCFHFITENIEKTGTQGLTFNKPNFSASVRTVLYFLRFFFWCGPFLKSLLNLLQYCFCFMFWFFGHKACGILSPPPGIESAPPALEGEVLTTGLPGKSLRTFLSETGSTWRWGAQWLLVWIGTTAALQRLSWSITADLQSNNHSPFQFTKSMFLLFPFNADNTTYRYLPFTDQKLRDKSLRNFPKVFKLSTGSASSSDIKSHAVFTRKHHLSPPPIIDLTPRAIPGTKPWSKRVCLRVSSLLCPPFLTLWVLNHPEVYPVPTHPYAPLLQPLCVCLHQNSISTWHLFCAFEFYEAFPHASSPLDFDLQTTLWNSFSFSRSARKMRLYEVGICPSSHSSPFLCLLFLRSFQPLIDLFIRRFTWWIASLHVPSKNY